MNNSTMKFCNQNLLKLRALQLCACWSGTFRSSSSLTTTSPEPKEQNLAKNEEKDNHIVMDSAKKELVQSITYGRVPGTRRNTKIIRVDPIEWEHLPIGNQKIPYVQRVGDSMGWAYAFPEKKYNMTDRIAFTSMDIDLRPAALRRIWKSIETEHEIKQQAYNPERHKILGNELATAHFVVSRLGKVKFLHMGDWVTQYRVDQHTEEDVRDLIPLTKRNANELCTLPITYDPLYRVEAIDASGVPLLYNGLANFEGLSHLTWLSVRGSHKLFNDWCLDRVYNLFADSLEYLDVSECSGISERGLAAAWKLKHLKTLVVENMPHIKNLEMVCSLLEDKIPGLTCIGVDYERKAQEIKAETEEAVRAKQERLTELETITINVTPRLESESESHGHERINDNAKSTKGKKAHKIEVKN